ncbi:chromate resistance protein ChrB [Rhodococcus sp. G-MC3]|nr:Chromate resistance protein ChrB [Rhodococcus sp. G-MC3]MDJ0396561.1 chromate resistance protein ChrB [Rhodococcus sp. G-MC3]
MVLLVKLPTEPSRHRVAVWRELRRVGALSLGQGVWAAPDVPVFSGGIARAVKLTEGAGGESILLHASGVGAGDAARFEAIFTAAREEEWVEYLADCGKYDAELEHEIRIAKFTLAELEEEEQSLDRLRRWHRDVKSRDVFGAPSAEEATRRLQHCTEGFANYTELVFAALHSPDSAANGML